MAQSKPRMRVKAQMGNGKAQLGQSIKHINKTNSQDFSTGRVRHSEMGYSGLLIRSINGRLAAIENEEIFDLSWPHNLDTYSAMLKDDAVRLAIRAKTNLIIKALHNYKITAGDKDDPASVEAAEFIDWSLKNLEGQSFFEVLESICTYNIYGFAVLEKIFKVITEGEYAGRVKLKRLASRSQRSIDTSAPTNYTEDGRQFLGINQSRRYLPRLTSVPLGRLGDGTTANHRADVITIPASKVMMFSYEGWHNNKLGNSPLKSVYVAWKEKTVFEEYQTIGAVKDLGGVPLAEIPIEVLNKAEADGSSSQGQFLSNFMADLANFHAGDQAYMLLPSDRDEKGNKLFDVNLMDSNGGKSLDLSVPINQRRQAILDAFGAGFMNLGNEGGGSYAMMDGKVSVHEAFTEKDISFIIDVFQRELFPQLLALNGIKLKEKQMPIMTAGPISEMTWETISATIQRLKAVGYLPVTVELVNEMLSKMGLEYRVPEDTSDEELRELLGDMTSRSGDGMANGLNNGVGESTSSGSDRSTSNLATESS